MYKPLSCCLQTYLPYETLPVEIKLLREFERRDFSSSSPLMSRPVTEAKLCKCVAVDIKYLPCLKRELTKKMLDGYYEGVSAQMNAMLRENKSAKEHFLVIISSLHLTTLISILDPSCSYLTFNFFALESANEYSACGDQRLVSWWLLWWISVS